ncbi:MAG TPA: hypothetical protein VK419_14010 [Bryobacteraceae bacterium]|nr:hypothetical protein [Bryobacteraceae bacterium]
MAGYLDEYGVADERRERRIKRIVIWGLAIVSVAAVAYFTFRNWNEEQQMKKFFTLLEQKKYQDAYALWGCTADTPCKYYSPDKFLEDWGESSPYANPQDARTLHEDVCGTGVVFDIQAPKADEVGLYVDRNTKLISFAPWTRCPGPHLQIWEFFKQHFG